MGDLPGATSIRHGHSTIAPGSSAASSAVHRRRTDREYRYCRHDPRSTGNWIGREVVWIAARTQNRLIRLPIADNQSVQAGALTAGMGSSDHCTQRQPATV
jgi:hypothetical protein